MPGLPGAARGARTQDHAAARRRHCVGDGPAGAEKRHQVPAAPMPTRRQKANAEFIRAIGGVLKIHSREYDGDTVPVCVDRTILSPHFAMVRVGGVQNVSAIIRHVLTTDSRKSSREISPRQRCSQCLGKPCLAI